MNHRHRSEAGFALLEVIVSAAVLALLAIAVLAGIDGAQSSTGREKSRSVAANLAEQDQERLRSLQVDSLADYTETRTVNVDGADYSIVSTGSWVRDDTGGTVSCQNNSKQADYLQITSTVTSKNVGTNIPPVVIKSLSAPSVAFSSTRGSLAVQVNNRDGIGVSNLMVNIDGPSSDNVATNESGCAVFQFIPIGNYDITLNRPGWVNHFGDTVSVGNQDVTAGKLNVRTMDYDQAATVVATVNTWRPTTTTRMDSTAARVSVTNSGESGLQRVFSAATPALNLTLDSLFPFKAPYAAFTGGCAEDNPVNYTSNYFVANPGSVATNAGGNHTVLLLQPPVNFRVRNSSGTFIDGATVKLRQQTNAADCTEPIYSMTTMTNPYKSTTGWPTNSTATYDPGVPFGTYDVCLEYKSQSSPSRWKHDVATLTWDNTTLNTSATTNLPANASSDWSSQTSSSGYCDGSSW
jgi:type II secretory pathway pseudopilin PulG